MTITHVLMSGAADANSDSSEDQVESLHRERRVQTKSLGRSGRVKATTSSKREAVPYKPPPSSSKSEKRGGENHFEVYHTIQFNIVYMLYGVRCKLLVLDTAPCTKLNTSEH